MNHREQTRLELLARADLLLLAADAVGDRKPSLLLDCSASTIKSLIAAAWGEDTRMSGALVVIAGSEADDDEVIMSEHTRLFEGAVACPRNESTYIRRDKGAIIGDICGFYRAFGFRPAPGASEKPDSISHELEFIAALLVMRASALENANEEAAAVTNDAIAAFLRDHLCDWCVPFACRLRATAGHRFYTAAADLIEAICLRLAETYGLDVALVPESVGDDAAATPYECGLANESSPISLTTEGRMPAPR